MNASNCHCVLCEPGTGTKPPGYGSCSGVYCRNAETIYVPGHPMFDCRLDQLNIQALASEMGWLSLVGLRCTKCSPEVQDGPPGFKFRPGANHCPMHRWGVGDVGQAKRIQKWIEGDIWREALLKKMAEAGASPAYLENYEEVLRGMPTGFRPASHYLDGR
jgi:hypothetical protein